MKFSNTRSLFSLCLIMTLMTFSISCKDEDSVGAREVYLGVYDGDETCDDDEMDGDDHPFSVTQRGDDGNDVTFGNLTNRNYQLDGVVNGNSVTIAEQIKDGLTISASGNRMDNDDLVILYTIRFSPDSVLVCQIEGDKE